LWPHQREAVDAAVRALAGGGRATVVSACGTGKTRIASAAVNRLAAGGRVLVGVPTLELAAQTLREWRDCGDGPLGTVVVVCSDPAVLSGRDIDLGGDVTVSTLPGQVAAACAVPGRVTVLSTYDSMPVVAAAHASHDLPRWDCVVADEAHRTTGCAGGAWTTVHRDGLVPAVRRLYMTATPRVSGAGDGEMIAMDDEAVFGPVCYRLPFGEAIGLGLLADYRVVVLVITDAGVRALARDASVHMQVGGTALGPDVLAAQVAVLRAVGEFGIRRAVSYHPRIEDARRWATALPQTARMVPDGPAQVWAAHLEGAHTGRERRRVLARLGAAGDEVCLVANAKVLTEGVDVPAVDAVVFTAPRNSVTCAIPKWEECYGAAEAYSGEHGHLDVPRSYRLASGFDLGGFLSWMRTARTRGELSRAREDLLNDIGMIWNTHDARWERGYALAAAFRGRHGHLLVPDDYVAVDGEGREYGLGKWLKTQRERGNSGRLHPGRGKRLDAIGMIWNARQHRWERGFSQAGKYVREYGDLTIISRAAAAGPVRRGGRLQRWHRPWVQQLPAALGWLLASS